MSYKRDSETRTNNLIISDAYRGRINVYFPIFDERSLLSFTPISAVDSNGQPIPWIVENDAYFDYSDWVRAERIVRNWGRLTRVTALARSSSESRSPFELLSQFLLANRQDPEISAAIAYKGGFIQSAKMCAVMQAYVYYAGTSKVNSLGLICIPATNAKRNFDDLIDRLAGFVDNVPNYDNDITNKGIIEVRARIHENSYSVNLAQERCQIPNLHEYFIPWERLLNYLTIEQQMEFVNKILLEFSKIIRERFVLFLPSEYTNLINADILSAPDPIAHSQPTQRAPIESSANYSYAPTPSPNSIPQPRIPKASGIYQPELKNEEATRQQNVDADDVLAQKLAKLKEKFGGSK